MTEIMMFTHYHPDDISLTTVIYVNNLCSQVGDWGTGELGEWE